MEDDKNIESNPAFSSRNTSSTSVERTSKSESSGTETSTNMPPTSTATFPVSEFQKRKYDGEINFSSMESTSATDPMVVRRLSSEDGVLDLPSLTGTDLASFALTRSHSRLSVADLNTIGMALMKDAVMAEKPNHAAAAQVFASMTQYNIKTSGPKKVGSTDRVRFALERAAAAIDAERRRKRTVVDIPADVEEEQP